MQKVVLLSGPSGVGKNTLGDFLLQQFPELSYSVSATSRPIRNGEAHGVDYHFISNEEFEEKIRQDELLEWQEVYEGTYYGTLKSELDRINQFNQYPLLVVDVFGAINVMKNLRFKPLSLFIQPPSLQPGPGRQGRHQLRLSADGRQAGLQVPQIRSKVEFRPCQADRCQDDHRRRSRQFRHRRH